MLQKSRAREVKFSSALKTRRWLIRRQTEAGSGVWLARLFDWSSLSRWRLIDWVFWRMPAWLLQESRNCVTGFDVIVSERERDDHLLMPPLESGIWGGGGGGGRAVYWEESSIRNLVFCHVSVSLEIINNLCCHQHPYNPLWLDADIHIS